MIHLESGGCRTGENPVLGLGEKRSQTECVPFEYYKVYKQAQHFVERK